ncbi:T2E6.17 [Arabidopsis thaliana]|uniref:AGAMOUS-like 102 n=1 Tax=Arabidopsis thaliana TaxID=3702 RepID=Q9FZF2_ARATH|nr:AGAMOUS-like 102 [Arabidopsis thaliana]AAF99799.1 T2E6.17 [Arabidopsis thaliana]AAN52805.1 MADS-box protein AGL102 [Arabidopsis thaliana]AEE32209.1 AGAMOUS-like 102 [Arabidopsis thaliana]|eukprot:NP_175207.1 AGAMOUS-like 102 [Arabidopsis thaliana]
MGRRKIEIKFIEDSIERKATFSRRRNGIFKKADELAKLCNVEIAVLVISPTNIPYTYGYPCFNDVVERIQNPSASSKLRSLMKELEQIKEFQEDLRKKQQRNLEKSNMKENVDLKLEDLVAFKAKLEAYQAGLKRKHVEMEDLSSPSILSKNTKNKMMRTEYSSGQSKGMYEFRAFGPGFLGTI